MPIFLIRLLGARPHRHALLMVTGVLACVLAGGALFSFTQHLPITTGWYWALETATTVGYGDVSPHNASGRLVASLVMLTTIPLLAGAFALVTGSAVASGLRRLMQMGARFPEGSYRLVLGMHPAIPVVLEELGYAGDSVVLVADVDPSTVPPHVHFVRGDPTSEEALRTGRPEGADHVLIAGEEDGDVLVAAVLVHQEAPEVPITALVGSRRLVPALRDLGVSQVLSPDDLMGHTVAKGLEAPHASELLTDLLRGEDHRLSEVVVEEGAEPSPLSAVRRAREGLILGVAQHGTVSLGIVDDPEVRAGDVLLVVQPNDLANRRQARHRPAPVE